MVGLHVVRVLLDCDGVLADFRTPCLEIINELSGTNHSMSDIKEWDIFRALNVGREIREETYRRMNSPGWCQSLKPYEDAIAGVEDLRKHFNIYIVTAPMRGMTWHRERELWLTEHFGFQPSSVIHTSAKYAVHGDAMIDDKRSNLMYWKEQHVNRNGLALLWGAESDDKLPTFTEWPKMISYMHHHFGINRTQAYDLESDVGSR